MKKLLALVALSILAFAPNARADRHDIAPEFDTPVLANDAPSFYNCRVLIYVQIVSTLTSEGGDSALLIVESSANGYSDWVETGRLAYGQSGTVTSGTEIVQTVTQVLEGACSYERQYYRITKTGSAAVTILYGFEINNINGG